MRDERPEDAAVVRAFSDLYWLHRAPWTKTSFLGTHVAKSPMDLWVYQEVIFETRPDLIVELGTNAGGAALWFATILDAIGHGRVLTVEKEDYRNLQPQHPRIAYLMADTIRQPFDVLSAIVRWKSVPRGAFEGGGRTMLSLDSLHTYDHVYEELSTYAPHVSPGCYAVVEDGVVDAEWGTCAARAAAIDYARAFVDEWEIDKSREHHLFTMHPDGWLRRK